MIYRKIIKTQNEQIVENDKIFKSYHECILSQRKLIEKQEEIMEQNEAQIKFLMRPNRLSPALYKFSLN